MTRPGNYGVPMSYPEAERQYYLTMAGIQMWYAREPLAGAAPSPQFDSADESVAMEPARAASPPFSAPQVASPHVASRARASQEPGQGGGRIANLQALMSDDKPAAASVSVAALPSVDSAADRSAAANQATTLPEASVEDGVTVSNLRVTMGLWAAGDVVLISSVSDDASERLQDTLANNILAALGFNQPVVPEYLRWPVFANPLVPGNGFGDFSRLLASMADRRDGRRLILLGVLADHLEQDRDSWLAGTLGSPAVDFAHTLSELAAVPDYKRALWRELKPLVRGVR